jgi:hypothetical protein
LSVACLAIFWLIWRLRDTWLATQLLLLSLAAATLIGPLIVRPELPIRVAAILVPFLAGLLAGPRMGLAWTSIVGVFLASLAFGLPATSPAAAFAADLCFLAVALGLGTAAMEALTTRSGWRCSRFRTRGTRAKIAGS